MIVAGHEYMPCTGHLKTLSAAQSAEMRTFCRIPSSKDEGPGHVSRKGVENDQSLGVNTRRRSLGIR